MVIALEVHIWYTRHYLLGSQLMNIHIEKHPSDPCGRLVVQGTASEAEQLDLLYQAVLSTKHKEGKYTSSDSFVIYFQVDPPINS